MKVNKAVLLLLAASLIVFAGCKGLQRRDNQLAGFNKKLWNKLGERKVRLKGDRDVIPVTFLKGRYRRVMIVVRGSAIEMNKIKFTFGNGETFSPDTRLHFSENTRSRVIDLPGAKRTIQKTEFSYKSKNVLTGFAEVELWGRK